MQKSDVSIEFSPIIVGAMRLGVWGVNMSTDELEKYIDQCLELGLKDFDHADIYGHYTEETRFGKVIKRRPDLKIKIRLTTKCGIKMLSDNRPSHKIKSYDSGKEHIIASAENSLKELGVDCLDLYLIHRPDYLMDPEEIAEAVESLKKAGKIKHFGVSNFSPSQFDLLNSYTPLATNQIEVSLLHLNSLDDGSLDQCIKHKISPTAWSPFGGGSIFSDKEDPRIKRIRKTAAELGEKYGASIDQILLTWVFRHPSGIVPIVGSSKIERIKRAAEAAQIKLSREDWYELLEASRGEEVP
ncbi:MAG: aldo/keto reductase [Bacteroidota bacterium]